MRLNNLEKFILLILITSIFLVSALKTPEVQTIQESCLSITFDDGHKSDLSTAALILNEYDIKATFFIIGETYQENKPLKLNKSDIKQLLDQGHEIGSHTMTHQYTSSIDPEERYKEIVNSKLILEHDFNTSIKSIAFPYSDFESDLLEFTYLYYDNIRLDQLSIERNTSPEFVCEEIYSARNQNQSLTLLFHDVSEKPGEWGTQTENFKIILSCINHSKIKVDTFNNCQQ